MRSASGSTTPSKVSIANLLVALLCAFSMALFVPAPAFAWVVSEEGYYEELLFDMPSSITLVSGETYDVAQLPGCGKSKSVTSTDESVAFANYNSGHHYIYPRRPGSTVITFSNKASTVTVNVSVVAGSDWSIECKDDPLKLRRFYSTGAEISDYRKIVSWQSSDESVVTIGHSEYCTRCSNGYGPFPYCGQVRIVPENPGRAFVTATDEYGNSRSIEVRVNWNEQEAAADWSLNPGTMSVEYDDSFVIGWEGYGVGDLEPSDSRHIKLWESSDSSVVKLSKSGSLGSNCLWADAVGVGTATITATDTYGNSRSCEVTVTQPKAIMNPVIKKQEYAYSAKNVLECKSVSTVAVSVLTCEYWRATGNGKFKLAKTKVEKYGVPDWVDKGVKPNTKYRYKVRYSADGGKTFGPFSEAVTFWTAPKRNATGVKKNGSTVSWSKVPGATGYCVFLESDEFLGYNIFGGKVYLNTVRGAFTSNRSAVRKWVGGSYEKVNRVAAYAKHDGKYYADGEWVGKKRSSLWDASLGSHRWHT